MDGLEMFFPHKTALILKLHSDCYCFIFYQQGYPASPGAFSTPAANPEPTAESEQAAETQPAAKPKPTVSSKIWQILHSLGCMDPGMGTQMKCVL